MSGPASPAAKPMRDRSLELTPRAVTELQRWLLLLAADDTAPRWSPIEDYGTPDALRAAAHWLVDNGHSHGLDVDLVGVLLALFSIDLREQMTTEIDGRRLPRDAA
jgi:hypothetical protein